MTPASYRARIAELGLTQIQAGKLFGRTGRTGQNWAKDGPPKVVAMLLITVGNDRRLLDKLSARADR